MLILKTLTLAEFADKLRAAGMPIGFQKLKVAIEAGVFKGCVHMLPMTQDEYIIIEKDVTDWIAAHSVEVHPTDDMLLFAQHLEAEGQGIS